MAILYINTGTSANAGNGDSIRLAFTKVNNNFEDLLGRLDNAQFPNIYVNNGYFRTISNTGTFTTLDLVSTGTAIVDDLSILGNVNGTVNFTDTSTFVNITVTDTATIDQVVSQGLTVANTATFNSDIVVNGNYIGTLNLAGTSTFDNIVVNNTATLNDLTISGTVNAGFYQGFDDFNIIKDDTDGLNFRLRNIHSDSFTEYNLLDNINGGLTIAHQNSTNDSGRYLSGQNYIYGLTPTDTMNIGRYSDIKFYANSNKYYDPSVDSIPSIVITAADSLVRFGSDTIYLNDISFQVAPDGSALINGIPLQGGGGNGYTGSAGINGYTGSQGGQGGTGYTGSIGGLGYSGSKGDAGAKGFTGSQGGQGATGYAGSFGDKGYSGSKGDAGTKGFTGSVGFGYSGSKGDTGAQGVSVTLVGSTGTSSGLPLTGNPGDGWIVTDTGDLYFWNTGTNVWNNIGPIVGPQGNSGAKGDQGLPGNDGLPGDTGYTGSQGINGYTGSQGINGYTGSQGGTGQDGYTGSRGNTGFVGSQGTNGYTGSQGNIGQDGYTGSRGNIGYYGSQGIDGYTGSRGTAGYNGSTGYTGSFGDKGYTGSKGADGTSITILGSYVDLTALQTAHPSGSIGDAYILSGTGHLAVWNGSAWTDVGSIQGPQGDIGYTGSRAQEDKLVNGSYEFALGADGVLTLPSGNTRIGDVNGQDGIMANTGTAFGVVTQGTGGYVALEWIDNIENIGTTSTQVAAVVVNSPFASTSGTVQILTGTNDGPAADNIWEFGSTGTLTLPNGTAIGSFDSPNGIELKAFAQHDYVELSYNSDQYLWADASGAYIATNYTATGHIWTFAKDGVMSTPGHLIPNTDLAYDLGSTSSQWRSIYVGTGTVYIGGIALGVNQDNFVTVDGNPIITVNTAGNLTVQGDTNIVLGAVVISDTAPAATTPGSQWYNSVDGRTYVAYNGVWVDSNPTVVPSPETYLDEITIDGSTLNINGGTLTIDDSGKLLVNGSRVVPDVYGASLTASATDPMTSTGTLWFNTVEGRTYLKYNDQWVDVNPTVVPLPSTYLDEITIDGSTINMNGSTLAINTAGVLLVNGSEVTGSGTSLTVSDGGPTTVTGVSEILVNGIITDLGNGTVGITNNSLYNGSHSLTLDTDGTLVLPNGMAIDASDSVPTVKIGGTSTWISIDDGGAPPGFYVRTDAGGSDYQWNFAPDGVLYLSTASTILGNNSDPNVYIETSTTATTSTWTFGTDGVLTLPADTPIIKGSGTGTDVTIIASTGTNTSTWTFTGGGGLTFPDTTVQTTAWNDQAFHSAMATYDGEIITNTATIGVGGLTVNGPVTFNGPFTYQTTATTAVTGNTGTFYGDVYGVGALYAGVAGYSPLPSTVFQSAANVNAYIQNNFQNLSNGTQASAEWVATANNGDDSNHYLDMGIAGSGWDGSQSNSVGSAASANDSWVYAQGSTSTSAGGNLILGTIKNGKSVKILTGSTGSSSIVATFNGRNTNATTTNSGSLQVVGGVGISQNLYAGTVYSNDGYFRGPSGFGSIQLASGGALYADSIVLNGTGLIKGPAGYLNITLNSGGNGAVRFASTATVASTTNATSTTTGALIVQGGAGIARDVYVGGNVVIPNLPAFRVYGVGSTTITVNTTLTNTHYSLDYQQGGTNLVTSTGIFTAPVAGLYQINIVGRSYSNTGVASQLAVIKNHDTTPFVMCMVEWAANTTVNHMGASTVARLTAGSTLILKVLQGSVQFDANDNWSVAFLG